MQKYTYNYFYDRSQRKIRKVPVTTRRSFGNIEQLWRYEVRHILTEFEHLIDALDKYEQKRNWPSEIRKRQQK